MGPKYTAKHIRYSLLIFHILGLFNVPVSAQEDCVRACTKGAGINECTGSTPHDEADWSALDTATKNCYCDAAVNFSQCSPKCSTEGFSPDTQGRVFGQWRYVNQICGDVVDQSKASGNITASTTSTIPVFSSISVQLFATGTLDSVPTPTPTSTLTSQSQTSSTSESSSTPSSTEARTIAISVCLTLGALAIGLGIWFLLRRRKQKLAERDNYENREQRSAMVVGPDGFPMDQSGPNLVSPMKGDFRSNTIKDWIQEQERMKQLGVNMEPDAMTETLSVGYTLWSETDLCFTEMGAEDARDMETIKEEPDGEEDTRRTYQVV